MFISITIISILLYILFSLYIKYIDNIYNINKDEYIDEYYDNCVFFRSYRYNYWPIAIVD